MKGQRQRKFVVVVRKTRLQELVERFNTWPQAKFYLEHNGVDAEDYLREHDLYFMRIGEVENYLKGLGLLQRLERSFLPDYAFNPDDIVVVIGQDGLVANTLKYLDGQKVIGVNPDPERWDGKLLHFTVSDLPEIVEDVIRDNAQSKTITFAQAATNDGQVVLAVNDLFIGPQSHQSARYLLSWGGQEEVQSSSGIIVSTGFGSTGWFQSILAGAVGITGSKTHHSMEAGFAWDAKKLQFSVREPFPSNTTGTDLVFGEVTETKELQIESLMPEKGVIFSDGLENDSVAFNSGTIAQVTIAAKEGVLVCS